MGYAPQNVRVIILAMLPYEGLAGPGSILYSKNRTQLLIGTSGL